MNPIDLYEYAELRGIDVDWFDTMRAPSLSAILPDGEYCIAINPWMMDTVSKEKVSLAHELGHCETGSFYNQYSPYDLRQKHENRADKWAIQKLIPESELRSAVESGYTEIWDLADYFQVTEEFMRKAISLYKYGAVNIR